MRFRPFRRDRRNRWNLSSYEAEQSRQGVALADEAEAFLQGRLADHFGTAGRVVGGWTLLNRLAHATPDELRDMLTRVEDGWRRHPSMVLWSVAERSLAQRLLRAASTLDELRSLQLELLIPLELAIIQRSKTAVIAPSDVVRAVTNALDANHFPRHN